MKNLKGPGDITVRAFRLSSMMPLRNTYISTKQSYLCTNKSVNSHNPHISMNKINNDINTKLLFWHKKRLKCLTFNQHWVIIYIQPILGINILLYEIDLSCFTEKPVYRNDWMPFNTAWLNLFCLRRLQNMTLILLLLLYIWNKFIYQLKYKKKNNSYSSNGN